MPTIQALKKQLKGIKSTQKLSKAIKTVSTVKFSKLNEKYGQYAKYGEECQQVFDEFGESFIQNMPMGDANAPVLYLIVSSNKGLCGNFNSQLLNFAFEEISKDTNAVLAVLGKKAVQFFETKGKTIDEYFELTDVPSFEDGCQILDEILEWRKNGRVSAVKVIYPSYINMMTQKPCVIELFSKDNNETNKTVQFVPDKKTVSDRVAKSIFHALFYKMILEAALGAQAATLMTMRSAYDTATEYSEELEGQINRMRQSAVTADVIETSAEFHS